MPTRFYFASTGSVGVSPTINAGGEWEHVNSARLPMRSHFQVKASALGNTAYSPDGADHLVNGDAHVMQFVSDDILMPQVINAVAAKWQFQCLESNAGNNVALTIKIFVVGSDATIKETLLAIARDAAEMNTSLRNISGSGTLSSATVEYGDRLCIELGCGGTPTAAGGTQGHNCTIRFGENGYDLPENETETATTYRPWLEIAQDLQFENVPFTWNNYQHISAGSGLSVSEKIR